MPSRFDVAVYGAGVFGSWTAWHIARSGKSVVLIDPWGPAHSRASSGGESRLIRMSYGADEIYTRMAVRSLAMWQDLFNRTGQRLFHQTGVLWMGRDDDPNTAATRETLMRTGVPFEIIRDLPARYPQMRITDPRTCGILEPQSGVLMARRAVALVVEDAGVTRAHSPQQAGVEVYACGPWLPKLFPELLKTRIRPTRQEVFFFAPPARDVRFSHGHLPAWIDFADPRGPYGTPDLECRGFKLALDRHGPDFDPDAGDRRITAQGLQEAREFLAERFPALRDAPLTESRVCQYENTSSGDFLIDRHPDHENVWLVGGGSGHGFKHGPAVGEYVCDRVLRGGPVEPRFSLAAKLEARQRTVY